MHDPYAPEPIDFRRPRLAGDVLSDSLSFVRDHFVDLGKGLLYIAGPAVVAMALASAFFQRQVFDVGTVLDPNADPTEVFSIFGPAYFLTIVLGVVALTLVYAVGYAYVFLTMDGPPAPITVPELWGETKRLLAPVLFTSVGLGLLFVVSMVIFIVPCLGALAWLGGWIYLFPAVSLLIPARLIDEGDFFSAFRRARHLVEGYWGQTFGLLILVYVVMIVVGIVLAMPGIFVGFLIGFFGATEADALVRSFTTLSAILGSVSYLAYVLIPIATAMHYFNLVTKQEGAAAPDLEDRIDAIEQSRATGWDDDAWDEGADADRRW